MTDKLKDSSHNVTAILPHHVYVALVRAVVDRGDTLSGFGRRAIVKEMRRKRIFPPKGEAARGR